MKQTLSTEQAVDILVSDEYAGWSYAGARALVEYIKQLEEYQDQDIEMDRVALRCDYSEYESAWDAMYAYQPEDMPVEGEEGDDLVEIQEKNEAEAMRWLEERTTVIPFEGRRTKDNGHGGTMGQTYNGVIIQQF